MERHEVHNQWAHEESAWHVTDPLFLGSSADRALIYLDFESDDLGLTLLGTVRYAGIPDDICFQAKRTEKLTYQVYENGEAKGIWTISGRYWESPVKLRAGYRFGTCALEGLMTYPNQQPLGFKSTRTASTMAVQRIRMQQMDKLYTELRGLPPVFHAILANLYPRWNPLPGQVSEYMQDYQLITEVGRGSLGFRQHVMDLFQDELFSEEDDSYDYDFYDEFWYDGLPDWI